MADPPTEPHGASQDAIAANFGDYGAGIAASSLQGMKLQEEGKGALHSAMLLSSVFRGGATDACRSEVTAADGGA